MFSVNSRLNVHTLQKQKPIITYSGQFLNLLIGGAQRGESDFLRELGERCVGQQRHVSQELVDAIAEKKKKYN